MNVSVTGVLHNLMSVGKLNYHIDTNLEILQTYKIRRINYGDVLARECHGGIAHTFALESRTLKYARTKKILLGEQNSVIGDQLVGRNVNQ